MYHLLRIYNTKFLRVTRGIPSTFCGERSEVAGERWIDGFSWLGEVPSSLGNGTRSEMASMLQGSDRCRHIGWFLSPESYIKCIQLMYSDDTEKRFNFSNVDEVLTILPVASEVMFRDCMESCMRYLAAVRWSREQQAQLCVLLSSLNINTLPDLAAKLGMSQSKSDCEHLKMVTESLQELLQMAYH